MRACYYYCVRAAQASAPGRRRARAAAPTAHEPACSLASAARGRTASASRENSDRYNRGAAAAAGAGRRAPFHYTLRRPRVTAMPLSSRWRRRHRLEHGANKSDYAFPRLRPHREGMRQPGLHSHDHAVLGRPDGAGARRPNVRVAGGVQQRQLAVEALTERGVVVERCQLLRLGAEESKDIVQRAEARDGPDGQRGHLGREARRVLPEAPE
eukprot:scaffold5609_cov135-Isochrysis_galbana.AAC.4